MLADAATWSRANADVLRDTHWIGGNPGRLDVYGWAAWTPGKAIVTLRNPGARVQTAVIDLQRPLELPLGATRRFGVHDVWKTGGSTLPQRLDADHASTLQLAPFEVLTIELTPLKGASKPRDLDRHPSFRWDDEQCQFFEAPDVASSHGRPNPPIAVRHGCD